MNAQAKGYEFFTLRTPEDLPKKMVMRLNEAVMREIVPAKAPAKGALYCPYCVAWQPYKLHSWSGYNKCCGCGVGTLDFYTRADNKLFS